MTPTQHYACGFLFSPDRSRVVLIRKNRPAWQAGRHNGVGGKLEPGETPALAMRREFREETGVDLAEDRWTHVLTLSGADDFGAGRAWAGHFFRATGDVDAVRSTTDEPVEVHPVARLPETVIGNLRWIIPMLLDDDVTGDAYRVRVMPTSTESTD